MSIKNRKRQYFMGRAMRRLAGAPLQAEGKMQFQCPWFHLNWAAGEVRGASVGSWLSWWRPAVNYLAAWAHPFGATGGIRFACDERTRPSSEGFLPWASKSFLALTPLRVHVQKQLFFRNSYRFPLPIPQLYLTAWCDCAWNILEAWRVPSSSVILRFFA